MNEKQETKDQNPPTSQDSQKKQQTITINTTTNERLKRDEWSEGAVTTLLESYESKWILRNRAKLKGQDWEDVAKHVSSRSNSTKSPKTQTQCKNKIESMKKRYRSESASSDVSAWPLYSRLDVLLRGTGQLATNVATKLLQVSSNNNNNNNNNNNISNHGLVLLEPSQQGIDEANQLPAPISVANQPIIATAQNSHGSNGFDKLAKEDELETKSSDHAPNKNPMETDSSTPALYSEQDEQRCKKRRMRSENNNNNKRQKKEAIGIAESIRWLAEVVVRSEQTRMDTLKEIEKMRVEAEAKRGEMEIKRTEIIANTQLEIARIFANVNNKDKDVDSSLRIGRS
ncbi:trihelix transcription factor ASIL1-like [Vicia villosa]|uniref:trihelix transcription factor ASIL1-like n=1 Tax=Vicia villosa TaxID=3911 RepID=UPI00273A9DC3|nr:trihelix transcription factor ASIL1-like [Vicia villosa]